LVVKEELTSSLPDLVHKKDPANCWGFCKI
jgi:hypothetical protein